MKYLLILIFLVTLSHYGSGQQSKYWGELRNGKFEVGYQDTVLYNREQEYKLGEYAGPKPYFVSMWFPIDSKSGKQIEYSDYLKLNSDLPIESVTDSIRKVQMEAFINWSTTYNLDLWQNEDLTDTKVALSKEMLAQKLNVFKTSKYPASRYPTIIYHHGNGGLPFENSVLLEFLASYGYVIISSDYHWPNLRGRDYTQKSDQSLEDVNFIAKFSASLPFTNPGNLTYIGHSWGGAMALRLNQKGNPNFKRYLIFDSTIEQAVPEEFKVLNPLFDSLFHYHPNDFKTTTVVITSRGRYFENGKQVVQPYPQFIPFQLIDRHAFTFITLKQILNHGSFTSLEVMRSVFSREFKQKDVITVNEQFKTYQFLVKLTKDILDERKLDDAQIIINDK